MKPDSGTPTLGAGLALLLPDCVATEELRGTYREQHLFPEERAVIARAVERRRNEFSAVRGCARSALAQLGIPPAPILPGERGAPLWPPGVVGSMTHCEGYRAAAVAWSQEIVSIGIDAEPVGPLPTGVLKIIAREEEATMLTDLLTCRPDTHWDRILFSAKESVYKSWFPLTLAWLDFQQAQLTINPDGTFLAEVLIPGPLIDGRPLTAFDGRWTVADGLVLTAVAVVR